MKDQFELFPPDAHQAEINRCIDEALHHIEGQYVLNQLLAGVPWSKAFGIGGCYGPGKIGWSGNAKGIEMTDGTIITPDQILERAQMYKPSNP